LFLFIELMFYSKQLRLCEINEKFGHRKVFERLKIEKTKNYYRNGYI